MKDDAILLGLRANDGNAMEAFWIRYYDRIYPICAFILGQGPDARDVTVDILVDFIEKHVRNLSSANALYAFLRQAAIRRSIRYRDKKSRFSPASPEVQVSEEMTPEERCALNLMMPLLNQCLSELTPKAQASLRLKYSRKISNEQIGEMLGGSKSYIGRLLKNGRKSLRTCIERKMKEKMVRSSKGGLWKSPRPVVTSSSIETLVAARMGPIDDGCDDFEKLMRVISSFDSDDPNAGWVHDHVVKCRECREILIVLSGKVLSGDGAGYRDAPVGGRERFRPYLGSFVVKGAAAAAGVLLCLALVRQLTPVTFGDGPERHGTALVTKGAKDSFYVAAKRRGTPFQIHPLDRLLRDDRLGLFYSSEDDGYLAVLSRDNEGKVVRLFPTTGETSAPISAGRKVPLEDGAVVGEGRQCEWLIAVFSNTPLRMSTIAREIAKVERKGGLPETRRCLLDVSVTGARSVRVLPVTR